MKKNELRPLVRSLPTLLPDQLAASAADAVREILAEAAVIQFVVDHVARRSKTGLVWELPPALDTQLVAAKLKQRPGALKLSTVVHRVAVLSKSLFTIF